MVPSAADLLAPAEFTGDQRARFRFSGPFLGRQVTWHCELITLGQFAREQSLDRCQQFLEIDATEDSSVFEIRIGLMLDRIDAAAIQRSIIMVRKYKRLAEGVHRYGEVYSFA